MSTKNEVFEYLIDQLRQQVNNSQCEDLAHDVQSLRNQLRDASAQIKELHLALAKATGDVEAYKVLRKGGYVPKGRGYVVGEHAPGASVNCRCTPTPVLPEQSGCRKGDTQGWPYSFYYVVTDGSGPSGCRKEDTQGCEHEWRVETFYGVRVSATYCRKCGVTKPEECEHAWRLYGGSRTEEMCIKCGSKR